MIAKMIPSLNQFFETEKGVIHCLDKEIEGIWEENERLAKCLIGLGWDKEEIDSLIKQAIESIPYPAEQRAAAAGGVT